MTETLGTFSLVLHSHIPYVLAHGSSPHGTDWLSEAAAETYLPLLDVCHRLIADGISPKITLGLTPVLVEQLRDPSFHDEFSRYLRAKVDSAVSNGQQFRAEGNYHMAYLARFWEDWYGKKRRDFEERYSCDIVGGFAELQDAGHIEIITSNATHGYTTLFSQDTSIQAQVKQGVASYKRHFGRSPRGFMLPECAYRPRYRWSAPAAVPGVPKTPYLRKGIDEFLAENGIDYFFVDGHLLRGGEPPSIYADKYGPLSRIWRQFARETRDVSYRSNSVYRGYEVKSAAERCVAVYGRDSETGVQVWSGDRGYPGDEWYLEFHKKYQDPRSRRLGLRYWRVSKEKADLGSKHLYEPHRAEAQTRAHATHFVSMVRDVLRSQADPEAILCAVYDTELYGHWWFEGPEWLYQVITDMAADRGIKRETVGDYNEAKPPREAVDLPEGSWGEGGFHYIWLNGETAWSWKMIYETEVEVSELARDYAESKPAERILKQAVREAMLMMASDWQFCISTGGARDYAEVRLRNHYDNFKALSRLVRRAGSGHTLTRSDWKNIAESEARHRVFPDVDPRWIASLEASVGLDTPCVTRERSPEGGVGIGSAN